MNIKCVANTGQGLSPFTLQSKCHYLSNTSFRDIRINNIYTVYGISLTLGVLHFLLISEIDSSPIWMPADLFEIEEKILPSEWYFGTFTNNPHPDIFSAIWGYKELVLDVNHWFDLFERKDEAVRIFLRRKKEIDLIN